MITLTPGLNNFSLSFTPSSELDVVGYAVHAVQELVDNDFVPTASNLVNLGPETSVTVSTPAGGVWYVKIAAYDTFEDPESIDFSGLNYSALQSVEVSSFDILDTVPPAMPTGLQLTTDVSTSGQADVAAIIASWDANTTDTDFAGYTLQLQAGDATSYTEVQIRDTATYRFDGLLPFAVYSVRIAAFDKWGNVSEFSEWVAITTAKDSTPPVDPTEVAISGGFDTIAVSIAAAKPADWQNYEIQLASDAGFTTVLNETVSSASITTLRASEGTYYVRARSVDRSGNYSGWVGSTPASVTTALVVDDVLYKDQRTDFLINNVLFKFGRTGDTSYPVATTLYVVSTSGGIIWKGTTYSITTTEMANATGCYIIATCLNGVASLNSLPIDTDLAVLASNVLVLAVTSATKQPDTNGNYICYVRNGNSLELEGALIRSATIDTAKIKSLNIGSAVVTGTLSASRIGAGSITADKLAIGATAFDRVRLVGTGSQSTPNTAATLYINGSVAQTAGTRGYTVFRYNRATHAFIEWFNYDVVAGASARTAMTTYLNGLDGSSVVFIVSYGSIMTDDALNTALKRCGATVAVQVSAAASYPYALVGIPGIGEGNGLEQRKGITDSAADISTIWADAELQGIGGGIGAYTILEPGKISTGTISASTEIAVGSSSNGFIVLSGVNNRIAVRASTDTADRVQIGTLTTGKYGIDIRNDAGESVFLVSDGNIDGAKVKNLTVTGNAVVGGTLTVGSGGVAVAGPLTVGSGGLSRISGGATGFMNGTGFWFDTAGTASSARISVGTGNGSTMSSGFYWNSGSLTVRGVLQTGAPGASRFSLDSDHNARFYNSTDINPLITIGIASVDGYTSLASFGSSTSSRVGVYAWSSDQTAVFGRSETYCGVAGYAYGTTGTGVFGSGSGIGVDGQSSEGIGIHGLSLTGHGGKFENSSSTAHACAVVNSHASPFGGLYVVYTNFSTSSSSNPLISCNTTAGTVFNVQGDGTVQGKVWGTISDINQKENITPARDYLDDLCRVNVVRYSLIAEQQTEPTYLGVIAQELEAIFPTMVYDTPDIGTKQKEVDGVPQVDADGNPILESYLLGTCTKGVKYSVFIPMLVKVVQELKAQNDALAARVTQLESLHA